MREQSKRFLFFYSYSLQLCFRLVDTRCTLTYLINRNVQQVHLHCTCVDVSPGKYSQKLGVDFPAFASVKLSYPTGAILVNSTGDLLFNVTLNPLMLNPPSAQIGSTIKVSGTGFSLIDTGPCRSLSGSPVALGYSCAISGGNLIGSFTVASALPGTYTITATGQSGDFSSFTFTVLPPTLLLQPSSGPIGTVVTVTGYAFLTNDNPCTITGTIVSSPSCSITGNSLSSTFIIPTIVPGSYIVTVAGKTSGDGATAQFLVTGGSQSIALSPSSGLVGTPVSVSGSSFLLTDTICTLTGSIIASGSSTCSIAGGSITASFNVGNVAPGVYTVTATGSNGIVVDSATANFQILSPPPTPPTSVSISINLYVPPDFSGLASSKTWTSFGNNYNPNLISVSRQSSSDQVGPNWWKITISSLIVTNTPSLYQTVGAGPLVGQRVFVVNRSQYIRLFQVTSPLTAGRYFFKVFIDGASIGASNFPTIMVKGSKDPAYISGTLRDLGERNVTNAGQPIDLPNGAGAQVLATGIDYLGRPASAQAFINSTSYSHGQYTLFGIAPGTYNITAYAAGYLPAIQSVRVSVAAAQSLDGVDIYMSSSVQITGTVLSENAEHQLIPWGTLLSVSNNIGNPTSASTPTNRSISIKLLNLGGSVVTSDPPPYTFALTTNQFADTFDFSIRSESFDGRIPEDYANYTSGLSSNDYLLRAYVTSYIQIDEVRIHVTNDTLSTRSEIPLIRTGIFSITVHFKNSNSTGATLMDSPIPQSGSLTISAYDMQGRLWAQNTTLVTAGSNRTVQELQGISNARSFGLTSLFQQNYGLPPGTYHFKATFTSSPYFSGFANLGVANLYYQTDDVLATIGLGDGIVKLGFPMYKAGGILLTLYSVDDQLPPLNVPWRFPGATIKITIIPTTGLPSIYQTNTTQPAFQIKNPNTQYQVSTLTRTLPLNITGLQTGSYEVVIQTLGYTQSEILHLHVVLGGNADASVWMILNPVIDLTVAFKDEGLLSVIRFYATVCSTHK